MKAEFEKLAREKLEKEKATKEEELLKGSITKIVADIVNSNMEKAKEDLIRKSVAQSYQLMKNRTEKKENSSSQTVHRYFSCNECNVHPIVGIRYNCTVCYDYDLCEACEERTGDSHSHALVKHREEIIPHHRREGRQGGCPFKNGGSRRFGNNKNIMEFMKNKFEGVKDFFCKNEINKEDAVNNTCDITITSGNNVKIDEDVKVEQKEVKNEKSEDSKKCDESYWKMITDLKKEFDLKFSDEQIMNALKKMKGKVEDTLGYLFDSLK